jgi:hypothetical protein
VSSPRAIVPQVFSAPTVSAIGELPGEVIPPSTRLPSGLRPSLPAETITVRPAAAARATASHSGSVAAGSATGWPSERLMTRML